MVIFEFYAILTLLLFVFFYPWQFPSDIKLYILLIVATLFYAVNDRLMVVARKNLEVAVITLINRLLTVLLFISGIVIFGESINKEKIIGGGLIILANIVVLYKKGKFSINKYIVFAIIAVTAFSIAFIIDVRISDQFNLPFYLIIIYLVPSLIIITVEKLKLKNIISIARSKSGKIYIPIGVASAIWMLSAIRALQLGEVTVVAPLQSVAVFFNVVVAYFFLKEKKNILKKIIASVLVIIGVWFMVNTS